MPWKREGFVGESLPDITKGDITRLRTNRQLQPIRAWAKQKLKGIVMHHYFFTEGHEIFRRSVRSFVENEVIPSIDQWEEGGQIPKDIYKHMGELGFLGIRYPERYGGSEADVFMTVAFVEEIARCRSAGFTGSVLVHSDMASPHLAKEGTDKQKEKYLVPIIKGEKICAVAITEPNAGSDVAGITTTARKEGDRYVLNGTKTFITNGVIADIFFVAAKTDVEKGHHGISMFIVEKGGPGFNVSRKLDKMGWLVSDTTELCFEDCAIPEENLLGEENQGFYYIMQNFQDERLVISVACVAEAQQALEDTIAYAKERAAFGQTLAEFQVIRHKLADMAIAIETARQLVYHTARLYQDGVDCIKEVSMCKAYCAEVVNRVAYECLQIHGGYGYMKEYPIERLYRDARVWGIGGGTTEIMKNEIAKRMGV